MAAVLGFMAGIFIATIHHFSHDHAGYTSAALSEHFVPRLIATVSACALLFALIAAVRNWRLQKSGFQDWSF
ncbi:hypothetical protein [Microvirga zambiensis]|uniref:hypothetical protein n=1 Tax=Microvirga zambiensis TaxID=1402137 RepID=UPI00191EB798|nr:hypothetical protein [Microvirga zambiensis]